MTPKVRPFIALILSDLISALPLNLLFLPTPNFFACFYVGLPRVPGKCFFFSFCIISVVFSFQ